MTCATDGTRTYLEISWRARCDSGLTAEIVAHKILIYEVGHGRTSAGDVGSTDKAEMFILDGSYSIVLASLCVEFVFGSDVFESA
jgi:hypothetical protein